MTKRPLSARVSYRKNGRKYSLNKGAVLTASQSNAFNSRRLFDATPENSVVTDAIFGYDDNDNIITPVFSTNDNLNDLDVEVAQIHNPDGSLVSFPMQYEINGQTYNTNITTFTNNSPDGVALYSDVYQNIRGKYFTHNHPNATSFSFGDFYLAQVSKIAGIEAVPHRRNFWNSIDEISENRQRIINAISSMQQEYSQKGQREKMPIIERMYDFALRASPNPSRPNVVYHATPSENKGWSGRIPESKEWYSPNYMGIYFNSSLDFLSPYTRGILISHAMNEVFADRVGFRYSLVGL